MFDAFLYWATAMVARGPILAVLKAGQWTKLSLGLIVFLGLANTLLARQLEDEPGSVMEGQVFATGLLLAWMVLIVGFITTIVANYVGRWMRTK